MRKEIYLTIAVLLVLASIASVSAFGIGSPYWKERPLIMQPGEIKDVSLELQNMVGTSDITVRAELIAGSEIAAITDASTDYLVRQKTANTNVHLRVVISADTKPGSTYTITMSFSTVTSGATNSGVKVGSSIEKSFDVVVGGETEGVEAWMWVVAAIAVIIILALLLKPKKKARRR
jgi:hypothetical protein